MTFCTWFKKFWDKEKRSVSIEPIDVVKDSLSKREANILYLVNKHRSDNGLSFLKHRFYISSVAKSHSLSMAMEKKVNHNGFPVRHWHLKAHVLDHKWVGECVGFGYYTAVGYIRAWLESEEHSKILNDKRGKYVGISVEYDDDDRTYATLIITD